jgi:hypothetical protein
VEYFLKGVPSEITFYTRHDFANGRLVISVNLRRRLIEKGFNKARHETVFHGIGHDSCVVAVHFGRLVGGISAMAVHQLRVLVEISGKCH